jgi:hypothetical protein
MLSDRSIMKVAGLLAVSLVVAMTASLQVAQAQAGGAILVNVTAGGEPAKADVVILTATTDPQQVAKGPSGRAISVPDGSYDVEITCTELLDHPTQRLQAVKVAGETVTREAAFPAGTTILNVRKGGAVLKNVELKLIKKGGGEVPGTARPGVPFKTSPGSYDAEVNMGKGRTKAIHSITGIQVYDGAKRTIPVDL